MSALLSSSEVRNWLLTGCFHAAAAAAAAADAFIPAGLQ
jgi:hypothetical protein